MSITVPRLDDLEGPFVLRYTAHRSGDGGIISIPGHGGGRDGPTIPDRPEQEAWMRAQSGLRESWYLTWDIPNAGELKRFLSRIGAPEALS